MEEAIHMCGQWIYEKSLYIPQFYCKPKLLWNKQTNLQPFSLKGPMHQVRWMKKKPYWGDQTCTPFWWCKPSCLCTIFLFFPPVRKEDACSPISRPNLFRLGQRIHTCSRFTPSLSPSASSNIISANRTICFRILIIKQKPKSSLFHSVLYPTSCFSSPWELSFATEMYKALAPIYHVLYVYPCCYMYNFILFYCWIVWEKKRSKRQRRIGKIYPSECSVPKNGKER